MPPHTVHGHLGTYRLTSLDDCDQAIRSLTAALVPSASEHAQAPIRADIDLILDHRLRLALDDQR